MMLTGQHFVRDVFCKKCSQKLGWFYEFATEEDQRYKEGIFRLPHASLFHTSLSLTAPLQVTLSWKRP